MVEDLQGGGKVLLRALPVLLRLGIAGQQHPGRGRHSRLSGRRLRVQIGDEDPHL